MRKNFLLFIMAFVEACFYPLYIEASNKIEKDNNLYVFLCFGQSNMEGQAVIEVSDTLNISHRFKVLQAVDCPEKGRMKGKWYKAVPPLTRCDTGIGPVDYFGRALVESLPDSITIGVLNVSVGGCKIELFDKDCCEKYLLEAPDWLKNTVSSYEDSNPYSCFIELAKQASAQGVIKGILFHQGESNTGDTGWLQKVHRVYDNILYELGLEANSIPLIVGELLSESQGGICASMNATIAEIPKVIPNAFIVSSEGCEGVSDKLHFSSSGYRELGRRYASVMLEILSGSLR